MVAAEQRRHDSGRGKIPMSSTIPRLSDATSNFGRISVRLKPRSERKADPGTSHRATAAQAGRHLRDAQQFFTNPPLVRIGGQNSRSLYQFTLQAPGPEHALPLGRDFEKRMLRDVRA